MITPIEVPKLTLTMEEGTLLRWLKKEGEPVQKDEMLFELETDKATVEVASPASGQLKKILIREGAVVVGSTVGFIGKAEDDLPLTMGQEQPLTSAGPALAPVTLATAISEPQIVRASPVARRTAEEAGLNLADIIGTGPEGRITKEDVENAIASRAAGPRKSSVASDFRQVIAARTSQAWNTVPHIHIGGDLNAEGLKTAVEKARASGIPSLSVTDLLLFAVAGVLRKVPELNAVWRDGRAERQSEINLGFAVNSGRGVITPVIHGMERLSLSETSLERIRLRDAVLNRNLLPRDLEGGTFTLTNLGMYPVDFFAPIVNLPQCAILATGRVRQVAAISARGIVPVWKMWANIALDHRVADGAVGAQFLAELERLMESFSVNG